MKWRKGDRQYPMVLRAKPYTLLGLTTREEPAFICNYN